MTFDETLLELIRLAYSAAVGHEDWSAFLSRYAQQVRSPASALMVHDVANHHGNLTASVGIDPYWQRLYQEHYSALNIWTIRGAHLMQAGNVTTAEESGVTDHELLSTEFYNDYLRPQEFFTSFGGFITREDTATSYIMSVRSRSAGAYGEAELALLRALMPHLQCAMHVHERVATLENRLLAANDALHRLPWGVMFVSSDAKVIWMNRAAEAIVHAGKGLSISKDGLQAANNEESRRLRNALAGVVQTSAGAINPGMVLPVSRGPGLRPLSLLIAPLPSDRGFNFGRPVALVFVNDPDQKPGLSADAIQTLFGLSRSEARVAIALLQGKTLDEYAAEAELSLNTARTHVKRIFLKTGTSRQSELIRLLMGSAAVLRK